MIKTYILEKKLFYIIYFFKKVYILEEKKSSFIINPFDSLAIYPFSNSIFSIRFDKSSSTTLFTINPLSYVFSTITPSKSTISMFFIINISKYILI